MVELQNTNTENKNESLLEPNPIGEALIGNKSITKRLLNTPAGRVLTSGLLSTYLFMSVPQATNEVYAAVPTEDVQSGDPKSKEQEIQELLWSNIPIVQNEPVASIENVAREPLSEVLDSIRQVTATPILNIRDAAAGNDIGDLAQNSLIRIKKDVADPDSNDWAEVTTLDTTIDPETGEVALEEGFTGFTALNLTKEVTIDQAGNITFIDQDGNLVSIAATANIIGTNLQEVNMPTINTAQTLALSELFIGIGGGEVQQEIENDSLSAWSTTSEEESEQLTSYKRAIYTAAAGVLSEDGALAANSFDVGGTFGKDSLSMYVQEENGSVDVISAFKKNGNIIFTVVRGTYENNSDITDLNIRFNSVGFTSWEGLAAAYGKEAHNIAASITALEESNNGGLISEIGRLPEVDIFFSQLSKQDQFQQRLSLQNVSIPNDLMSDISEGKYELRDEYQYIEDDDQYRGSLYALNMETGEDILLGELSFLNEASVWINMPDEQLLQEIGLNSFDAGQVVVSTNESPKIDAQDGSMINSVVITLVNPANNEAIMGIQDENGIKWGIEALGPKFKRNTGINFGFAVSKYNERAVLGSEEGKTFMDFNASIITPESHAEGRNVMLGLEYSEELNEWEINYYFKPLDEVVEYAQSTGKEVYIHPLIDTNPERLGRLNIIATNDIRKLQDSPQDQALKEHMRDKYLSLAEEHITSLYNRYGHVVDAFTLLNEARLKPDNLWFQLIGDDYIERIFEIANEVDPDMEWVWNEWNRWDDEIHENSGDFLNSFANEIISLRSQGVEINSVGLQSHISTKSWTDIPASFEAFFIKMAQQGVTVRVTELDWSEVDNESKQSQQAVGIMQAARRVNEQFGREVVKGIIVWGYQDNHSWLYDSGDSERSTPLLIDKRGEPKQVYFDMLEEAGK